MPEVGGGAEGRAYCARARPGDADRWYRQRLAHSETRDSHEALPGAFAASLLLLSFVSPPSHAQTRPPRDEFFWLGEINKATAVINLDEGLLDRSMASLAYSGITKVLADGDKPGGKRPSNVITFEPLNGSQLAAESQAHGG